MNFKQTLLIIILILALILLVLKSEDFNKTYEEIVLEIEFNGVVKKKTIDEQSHDWYKVILESRESRYLRYEIYDKVQINDSIYKKNGSYYIYIVNSNSLDSMKYRDLPH